MGLTTAGIVSIDPILDVCSSDEFGGGWLSEVADCIFNNDENSVSDAVMIDLIARFVHDIEVPMFVNAYRHLQCFLLVSENPTHFAQPAFGNPEDGRIECELLYCHFDLLRMRTEAALWKKLDSLINQSIKVESCLMKDQTLGWFRWLNSFCFTQ
jgi:hypothetical protein